jgi:hypothetical protein
MGFDRDSNGHRVYLPDTRRVAIEQSVTFDTAEVRIPLEGPGQGNHVVRGYDVSPTPPAPVSHAVQGYDVGPTPPAPVSHMV